MYRTAGLDADDGMRRQFLDLRGCKEQDGFSRSYHGDIMRGGSAPLIHKLGTGCSGCSASFFGFFTLKGHNPRAPNCVGGLVGRSVNLGTFEKSKT